MTKRTFIVLFVLLAFAGLGLWLSNAAPYVKSDDEIVYLTGALQAKEGTLPDAAMLEGYAYGPYLHPVLMSWFYEGAGYEAFKSVYLVLLVLLTGGAAYALFRLLLLPFLPALLLSVIMLLPRFAAGTEFFGVFTFREAIGRSAAVPLFLLATGLLIHRVQQGRSTWPVFGLVGLLLFLHPVTVTLFAFISLLALGIVRLRLGTKLLAVVHELFVSGFAFALAGSYFFVLALSRLAAPATETVVDTAAYVKAVVFRNAWEFPAASLDWYRHMAIVSAFFLLAFLVAYGVPRVRRALAAYPLKGRAIITTWGISLMVLSLGLTLAIPGANLYFMEQSGAPYLFQQWSRLAKFYYLGLFIALVPLSYAAWQWYQSSSHRLRHLALVLVFVGALASSSVAFEMAQFGIGYANVTQSYIPQALSGTPDDTTPTQYREVCAALTTLSVDGAMTVLSNDFSFRYYCRADLHVTNEEGSAYTYRPRADLIWWHEQYLAQRRALGSGDLEAIRAFAGETGARAAIISRTPKNESLLAAFPGAIATSRHLVLPL